MKKFRLSALAACALLAFSGAGFAHEAAHGHPMHAAMAGPAAEQQDWGIAGDARAVTRTITLTLGDDMRFTPDRLEVKQGETVRLAVRNTGKAMHELVIGTPAALEAHAALMLQHPGMEHDEPHMAHVPPGKTGEIVWTFNRAGEFAFACLVAGHYEAGMKGAIRVEADPAAAPRHDRHAHGGMSMHSGMGAPAPGPYAGQQQRDIKALSAEETQAYAEGRGNGFAKAAELNGYPGPMHTLELAAQLGLTEEQRRQTEVLLARHKAEARRLGAELIEAERALDQAFAHRSVTADSLAPLTRAAGEKLAQLRAEHLQTHLAQTALLTPEQIERYTRLRGYASDNASPTPEMHHGHHPH